MEHKILQSSLPLETGWIEKFIKYEVEINKTYNLVFIKILYFF